jgi:hypothetical protein
MLANGFGFKETPASLNDKLKALGAGRGFMGALMVWAGLPAALPGMQLNNFVRCRDTPAPMATIDATLDAGKPVVIELDHSPVAGLQNHWVLIYARQGRDYLIHDPWPVPAEASASLAERYGFTGTPAQIITSAVFYDNPNGSAPVSTLSGAHVVVDDTPEIQAAGGLALRDAPVNGAIKMRLPAGTVLELTDPGAAQGQIGVNGQWISVRTPEGATGFVAAWLVHVDEAAVEAAATGVEKGLWEYEPVTDSSLIGLVQPPLRPSPELIVVVNRPKKTTPKPKTPRKGKRAAQAVNPPSVLLRAKPPRGKMIATLKPGATLQVLEPDETARHKIGKRGQWLHVSVAAGKGQGLAGYVSAASVHVQQVQARQNKATSRKSNKRSSKQTNR